MNFNQETTSNSNTMLEMSIFDNEPNLTFTPGLSQVKILNRNI